MIIKYGSSIINKIYDNIDEVKDTFGNNLDIFNKHLASIEPIKLDPNRYLYLRNHSISSLEVYGPNDNGDGFPREDLQKGHLSFVGSRVSLDHNGQKVIGMVLSSAWIPLQIKISNDVYSPFVLSKKVSSESIEGDYVQNILAIDKKLAAQFYPDLISLIHNGTIRDTSMGVYVNSSECPICNNICETDDGFCDHIKYNKLQKIKTASGDEKLCYEICRGLTFFEDSIIIPNEYGGTAGGFGADPNARVIEVVANKSNKKQFPILDYIVDRSLIANHTDTQQSHIAVEDQNKVVTPGMGTPERTPMGHGDGSDSITGGGEIRDSFPISKEQKSEIFTNETEEKDSQPQQNPDDIINNLHDRINKKIEMLQAKKVKSIKDILDNLDILEHRKSLPYNKSDSFKIITSIKNVRNILKNIFYLTE